MKAWSPATRVAAVCIGIIAVAAAICFGLSQHYKIDYPVLYRTYGAYPVDQDSDLSQPIFSIPYLECKAGRHRILDVRFEEFPQLIMTDDEEEGQDREKNGFFTRKKLQIALDASEEEFKGLEKEVTLTEALVIYEDDTQEKIDLGTVLLYPKKEESEDGLVYGGETYEEGNSRLMNIVVQEPLKIKSAVCIPELAGVEIELNGEAFADMRNRDWGKGRQLNFALNIDAGRYTSYEPAIKITYETKDGRTRAQTLGPFRQEILNEEPSFPTAVKYLKERGRL